MIELLMTGRSTPPKAVVAANCLLLAACTAVEDASPGPMSEGQALFEANCTECHGQGALGDGPIAASLPVAPPSLFEHLGHHPRAQLVRLIQSGVPPAMPPAPLTEAQILEVIDYAWTLVPDSMVAELREMQRMAEGGMEMDKAPAVETDSTGHANHGDTIGS